MKVRITCHVLNCEKKKVYWNDFNFHFYFPICCLCLRILSLIFSCMCAQSCPSLCNPMDYSPPGSSVHGIFQARILEWVAISFSGDLPNPGIKHISHIGWQVLYIPSHRRSSTNIVKLIILLQDKMSDSII